MKLFEGIDFAHTVIVIEDIDCASDAVLSRDHPLPPPKDEDQEQEEEKKSRLTLSGILNAVDGSMLNVHGQIMVMTTNHPEVLDAALTRAGRCDQKFEFDLCDGEQARNLFINFYGAEVAQGKVMPAGWPQTGTKSPADITGILIQYRMDPEEAWRVLEAQ